MTAAIASLAGRAAQLPALGLVYGLLWVLTLLAGGLGTVWPADVEVGRSGLPSEPASVARLVAHNAVVLGWPFALILLGWQRLPLAGSLASGLVIGSLCVQALAVGRTVGSEPALLSYLPHLPVEWIAVAAPAAAWFAARRGARSAELVRLAALTALALVVAGVMEAYVAPL